MKFIVGLSAIAAAFGLATSAQAAGDYVSIVQETAVNAPADVAWKKVKPYCDIGAWLKTTCEITSGKDGEVGAVRKIAGRIEEVIVATTPTSYTYADIDPKILYRLMRDAVWLSVRWFKPTKDYPIARLAEECTSLFLDGLATRR